VPLDDLIESQKSALTVTEVAEMLHVSRRCFVLDSVPVLRHEWIMMAHMARETAVYDGADKHPANPLTASLLTLRRYLAGQRRFSEVLEALRHIEYVCGHPVKAATTRFRRCLHGEDQDARNEGAAQCLREIGGWIYRNEGRAEG
jgi:hypothetical protein